MAVFRVEKNKGYTVMSNHHLNNRALSLKAKGLLSQMLSLPETWDYTLVGLSFINKESVDAIRTAVLELEDAGYIVRRRVRDSTGKLGGVEYTIYEQPQPKLENPILDNPTLDAPTQEKPVQENPTLENPTQLNTNPVITDKKNTDSSSTHPSIHPGEPSDAEPGDPIDRKMDAIEIYRQMVYENIAFEHLRHQYDRERLAEIAELIVDTVCSDKKTIRIAGEDKPAEVVKSRFMKLGQFHIEYVFECLSQNTTKIRNVKGYLLTTLYNASFTMDSYYQNAVNHDLYGDQD